MLLESRKFPTYEDYRPVEFEPNELMRVYYYDFRGPLKMARDLNCTQCFDDFSAFSNAAYTVNTPGEFKLNLRQSTFILRTFHPKDRRVLTQLSKLDLPFECGSSFLESRSPIFISDSAGTVINYSMLSVSFHK